MDRSAGKDEKQLSYREMTVANIRERPGANHVDVVFLESARFFRLDRDSPNYGQALALLQDAMREARSVRVGLASPDSEIIEEVRASNPNPPE